MRPLTALLGILMGSAVALASGLVMTWIVILFLPAEEARFAPEHPPLLRAMAVFWLFCRGLRRQLLWGAARARLAAGGAWGDPGRAGHGAVDVLAKVRRAQPAGPGSLAR